LAVARSKAEGRALLQALVARYSDGRRYYESEEFDEAATRAQFVDQFFQALGWDVIDAAGRGPDSEVRFHPKQTVEPRAAGEASWDADVPPEEQTRATRLLVPDYSFRVAGKPRLLVEAKRARASLDAPDTAFQVKTYGWNGGVPVGVTSNFRQLRVYDCRYEPVYDEPDRALLQGLKLGFSEYEEHWDLLWSILSREAVVSGSLQDLLGQPPRGGRSVDRAFLERLREWRESLAQDLLDRNPDLTAHEIAEGTQKILDRLVFLRTCEDREIEPRVILRPYARRTDCYRHLVSRFRQLDGAYNGALFREHFVDRLSVSDGAIQPIIEGLYPPRSPYVFDAIATEVLGTIYERFLGQEVVLRGGEAGLEDKPEVRHAGGVYYTPRWIVARIVSDCLDPLLQDKTPRTARNLRIVDLACGSGSFLLGALDYLIHWHERYYTANPNSETDRHYEGPDRARRLTSDAKAEIVSRCLYGVDIDPQAVEVAQLALYLKILEGETSGSLGSQLRLFHGALLPPLRDNFRCGNTLLGTDDLELRLLDDEQERRINPFDWRSEQHGFDQVFAERGGFDVVLGNPPYTRVQTLRRYRPEETDLYSRKYRAAAQGSFDIASLFVERGLSLLRPSGRLAFIISKQWAGNDAGEPLRDLLRAGPLEKIYDFGAGQVFAEATVYTMVLEVTAAENQQMKLVRVPDPTPDALEQAADDGSPLSADIPLTAFGSSPWGLTLPAEQELIDRLAATHCDLGEVSGDSIFQGPVTGADKVFRADDVGPAPGNPDLRQVLPHVRREQAGGEVTPVLIETDLLRPVLAGKTDFGRFFVDRTQEWLILPYARDSDGVYQLLPPRDLRRRYPHAHDWLVRNRVDLEARAGVWTEEDWYGYSRRQNLEKFDSPDGKILVPYMIRDLCGSWDDGGHFFVNVTTGGYGVEVAHPDVIDPRYVAALLNSHLLSYLLRLQAGDFRGGWVGARKGHLSTLPIALPDAAAQRRVVDFYARAGAAVSALHATRRGGADRDRAERIAGARVHEFDEIVNDVYQLTEGERGLLGSQPPGFLA
jgi:hypothetical protein